MAAKKKKTSTPSVWLMTDHLSVDMPSLEGHPKGTPVVLIENIPGNDEIQFHKKKLVLVFSAMRHLIPRLEEAGFDVDHYPIDAEGEKAGLAEAGVEVALRHHIQKTGCRRLVITSPSEFDRMTIAQSLEKELGIEIEVRRTNRFIMNRTEFREWVDAQQESLVMENFYRDMRKRLGILMEGDYPVGGRWNYDVENRVPPMDNMDLPEIPRFEPDDITKAVIAAVDKVHVGNMGKTDGFFYPVTAEQAMVWLDDFIEKRLRLFGMYQDAMISDNFVMYHSMLSPAFNIGLLNPMDAVRKVEKSYYEGDTPINSAEGFIRQIIGWREYSNGIYWERMPEYRDLNFFEYDMGLPQLFEDGVTRMSCMKSVIQQTEDTAYAHHIQRLMILGNFCLLTGVNPQAALVYFKRAFIDAWEWAAVPNVIGMILFADGGYLGTKPYAASANYISKMSDYCRGCFYKARKRVGERSCPFNYLYWQFLHRHEDQLKSNKRMGMVYNLLKKKTPGEMNLILTSSEAFLNKIRTDGTDRPKRKVA